MFRGSHISGPTHNYLGMRLLHEGETSSFELKVLPPIGDCSHHEGLTSEEVRPWIVEGLTHANEELGTSYRIAYAEVVENDSRRPEVYVELARGIVKAAHQPT